MTRRLWTSIYGCESGVDGDLKFFFVVFWVDVTSQATLMLSEGIPTSSWGRGELNVLLNPTYQLSDVIFVMWVLEI
jgi:hypothetical protein